MRKIFVEVKARFTKEGEVIPISFIWEDGNEYEIDRIYDKRPAPALKVGGQGIRFTCMVMGKMINLFLDNGKWFVEV